MPFIAVILSALGGIATFLSGLAGSVIANVTLQGVRFIATKALMYFLIGVALPVVLYNVFSSLIVDLISAGISVSHDQIGSVSGQSLGLSLTSLAGWLANQLYLPQCMSVYLSAVSARFAMSFIPFMR